MTLRYIGTRLVLATLAALLCASASSAEAVKRVVIVKLDGLPAAYVDRFVKQTDPKTGRSLLPWFEEIFYKNGTRVPNFYSRGLSLSGSMWGQLDTGQRLQIKGNVEFDRYTLHGYDYLNIFEYYTGYGLSKRKADMPGPEVLDQLGIPLLSDAFDYQKRYTSQQIFQRGNNWEVIASGFLNLYPGNPTDFIDEWTLGLDFLNMTMKQAERDIVDKLHTRPEVDYFDYYDGSFDHVSHGSNDTASRLAILKNLDGVIGRIWVAIQNTPRAKETAIVLVSDHGFNSDPKVYSQGFSLVKALGRPAGGGHHTGTKRRLMLDYSLKGLYPFVPVVKTHAEESFYLRDQSSTYPTALLDFDGNERSSIHLRNSDLNLLHILLQQMKARNIDPTVHAAARDAFFDVIERHRAQWRRTVSELGEEMDALRRWIESEEKKVAAQPKSFTPDEIAAGKDKEWRRAAALLDIAIREEKQYRQYAAMLAALTGLSRENFDPNRIKIEDLIAPGSMGEPNTVNQLQNYVVGVSRNGLILNSDKEIDLERSFIRVNYFEHLRSQRVRNNVQAGISNRPVDFVAVRLPKEAGGSDIGKVTGDHSIWLYDDENKQAVIQTRMDENGVVSYRYQAVSGLRQNADGSVTFKPEAVTSGFPLRYFEDPNFAVPLAGRAEWLAEWHTESEWMAAIHRTRYSNGMIGLHEQLDTHPIPNSGTAQADVLLQRFRQRQRHLTEPDLLILANDHWNFDVRGFNPGGNHGSFFRESTNSTLMFAGGSETGIARGLVVDEPYDSLSFVPTILKMMAKVDNENRPLDGLARRGFHRFPGRVISQVTDRITQPAKP